MNVGYHIILCYTQSIQCCLSDASSTKEVDPTTQQPDQLVKREASISASHLTSRKPRKKFRYLLVQWTEDSSVGYTTNYMCMNRVWKSSYNMNLNLGTGCFWKLLEISLTNSEKCQKRSKILMNSVKKVHEYWLTFVLFVY